MKEFGNLLVFNLVTDSSDPVLGFTTDWLSVLSEYCDKLYVISMRVGEIRLPDNVIVCSAGLECGYGKLRRTIRFYQLLIKILTTTKIDGCFSHMMPVFSVLASIIFKIGKIPLVTWYGHPKRHLWIQLAALMSDRIVTPLPSAFGGITSSKLIPLGQGINEELFVPELSAKKSMAILCVGRVTPAKRIRTLIEALKIIHTLGRSEINLVILGSALSNSDKIYQQELVKLSRDLNIEGAVRFQSGIPRTEIPRWYREFRLHVNLTPIGFGDKVALEAMCCGTPSLLANQDLADTCGEYRDRLIFALDDPSDLARKALAIINLSEHDYHVLSNYVRAQAIQFHGLRRLIKKLLQIISSLKK